MILQYKKGCSNNLLSFECNLTPIERGVELRLALVILAFSKISKVYLLGLSKDQIDLYMPQSQENNSWNLKSLR